ncbi:MAG: lipoprotein [Gammaproteobacteria bacterium]|nr:lipoprotein [Gammaproteobacteria bacterium]
MVSHRLLPILILALILSGCGQKGALYLPDNDSAGVAAQEL